MKSILFLLLFLFTVIYAEAQPTQQYIQFKYSGPQDKPIESIIFSPKAQVEPLIKYKPTPIIFVVSESDFLRLITVIKKQKNFYKIPYISRDSFPGEYSFILVAPNEKSMYGFGRKEVKSVFKKLIYSIESPELRDQIKEILERILYRT